VIDSEGFYGAEAVLLELARELPYLGIEASIVNMRNADPIQGSLEERANETGVPFQAIPLKPGMDLRGALRILRFAQTGGYDVIHSHGYKPNILLGMIPRPLRKLPMIATVHGWTGTGGWNRMLIYKWLDTMSLSHMDAVVLVNNAMTSHPRIRRIGGGMVRIIANGVAERPVHYHDADENLVRFCSGGFTILSIGRLSLEKGHRFLVEAYARVAHEFDDVRLLILGEGPERHPLERLISERSLGDRVLLPGYRRDSRAYVGHSKIFVLPSLTEGLPITLLEAMMERMPIIAAGVGGIPEIIKNGITGLLVRPGDTEDLYRCMMVLYRDDALRAKMASSGYEFVRDSYSTERMTSCYRTLYEELLYAE